MELKAELKAAAAAAKGRSGGSGGSCSSSGGGSEGDESGTSSRSEVARAAALQATAERTSGGGSAGGSPTAPKGKGKRKAGQQEQTDVRGGRTKRRRSEGAGRNATKAFAIERDSKKASAGRAEKMSDEPKSRQEVWDAGFDDDEAAMDFEDACYESDVEAREEWAQEEKKEREAWERGRKAEREKEKQKQVSKTFHRIKVL